MFKKLSLKAWVIIVFFAVLLVSLAFASIITALRKDENRLEYTLITERNTGEGEEFEELAKQLGDQLSEYIGTYAVTNVKSTYKGGIFAKETLVVPSKHKNREVSVIFSLRLNKTKNIEFSDGLRIIFNSAMDSDSDVESINIPSSVTAIGNGAFANCTGLKNITLPDGLTSISQRMFSACRSLESINIPDSVTSLAANAFYDCRSLRNIDLPDNLLSIGSSAFEGCGSLTTITLPGRVNRIANNAFKNCYSLIEVCNNSSLSINPGEGETTNGGISQNAYNIYTSTSGSSNLTTTSDGYVFYSDEDHGNLLVKYIGKDTDLTLPQDFNGKSYNIHNRMFNQSASVKKIVIADCVETIGNRVFNECSSLESVVIGNGVTRIGAYAFNECKGLKTVTFGNNVETIAAYAFFGCDQLSEVKLSDKISTIGDAAFSGCNKLSTLQLGANLTSVGENTFFNCYGVTSLNYNGTKAQWNNITLGQNWCWNNDKMIVGCTQIICTDGTLTWDGTTYK